ncbi:Holliday junction branch migration protein RuvA [Kiloniella litopenaei]|uniref:Holliday junction branch migration protein RuvA n=1 Tax=Kiloniella litopenaei TaxID=1549748 RepID=UPI003BA8683A
MIVTIEGTLSEAGLLRAIIETGGLGYEVYVPMTTTEKLPAIGKRVKLYTHAVYREDTQALYGFICQEERDFFSLLVEKVSGLALRSA